jgi:hypothetical protein
MSSASASQPTVDDLLQRAAAVPGPCDEATRESVRRAWSEQPDVVCGLVQRALSLESELAAARHQIERLKRMNPAPAGRPMATREDLQRQSEAWGRLLGTASRPRAASTPAPAARPRRARTFEDVGARFFADHVGKVWLALLLLTTVVVLVKEKIV